jgi:hypothetical protein
MQTSNGTAMKKVFTGFSMRADLTIWPIGGAPRLLPKELLDIEELRRCAIFRA